MIFIAYILSIVLSYAFFFPRLALKMGEKPSIKSYIPIYNILYFIRLLKRPFWWFFLFFVPGVNVMMIMALHIEIIRAFRQESFLEYILALFVPPVSLYRLSVSDITYQGAIAYSKKKKDGLPKKGFVREWFDAIAFALIATALVRGYCLEAFTIPTGSMEKEMLIGDYLFVNKMKYGARIPNTPLSIPLFHHTLPFINIDSYLEWVKIPYSRLVQFADIERNDIVVFNFPAGDTVILEEFLQGHTYSQILADEALFMSGGISKMRKNPAKFFQQARENFEKQHIVKHLNTKIRGLRERPVDKREHYVKRCVAIAGDTLEIKDKQLFINSKEVVLENGQYNYIVISKKRMSSKQLKDKLDINYEDMQLVEQNRNQYVYIISLTKKQRTFLENLSYIINIELMVKDRKYPYHKYGRYFPIFPNHPNYNWTEDNFGPLIIPKRGDVIPLNVKTLPIYHKIITCFEKNTLRVEGEAFYINDTLTETYTIRMNYYWMMGDNRDNSADSRMWGFVPEDHIVGTPTFVWFSKDKATGIRWNRIFTVPQ